MKALMRDRSKLKLSDEGRFRQAIHCILLAGAGGTGLVSGNAHAQDSATPGDEPTKLEVLEVTGSRIRRVDMETASPIYTVDRTAIQTSGVATIGELLQELPSIRGNATNPRVNNGGGDGASEISLRGLGEDRTLVLLNGRRMVIQDVNAIPLNMIDRVDVLTEGASAIYGSDAVAGVVNFITRKDYSNAQASYDYGVSGESDGKRHGLNLSWGTTVGRASLMLGLNYNQQDGVSAGDRDFAKDALYLYGGTVYSFGSSRTPNGRIFLPASFEDSDFDCVAAGDPIPSAGISVTRIEGATGSAVSDYRCYAGDDAYNYQPLNLVLTPQERAGIFTVGNYQINDDLEIFTDLFHSQTKSGFQIAPLPFDGRSDNVVLSADSLYNPFGVDLGGLPPNTNFLTRLERLGTRRNEIETGVDQGSLGLRGTMFDTTWNWDVAVGYGRIRQTTLTSGYLYQSALTAALGPSFDAADNDPTADADGDGNPIDDPTCGTPGDPIAGCIPVNFFNLQDPTQVQALSTISAGYSQALTQTLKGVGMNFTGDVLPLPAGSLSAAVGFEYREERLTGTVDFLAQAQPPDFLNCFLAQETCTNATNGAFDVREYYAEAFIPILADRPGVESLNANLGIRHSNYSSFGDTDNGKLGLEYRPIQDLLLRVSYAEVFRAPTITDLFLPSTANAPTFNDPCVGLTQADVDATPNLALACENVPTNGSFTQPNAQVTGLFVGNANLDPETGDVLTWGVVYDPDFVPGLSVALQLWNYDLEDTIEALDVNTIADQCIATGAASFCGLIDRFSDGTIRVIDQPTANLGRIEAEGLDAGFKYRLDDTGVGRFRFGLDLTYINKFDRTPDANFPDQVNEVAGRFDRQDGNFARLRGIGQVDWSMMGFEALWAPRYIGPFKVEDPDGAPGEQPTRSYGSIIYHDFTAGYSLPGWKTKFQVGVNNAFDKDPPILFQNNVINANTDVETYDTVGRFMWVRVTQDF